MKSVFIFFLLFPVPSFAQVIFCQSTRVTDAGYGAEFALNRRSVKIIEDSIAGPRPMGFLPCHSHASPAGRSHHYWNTLVCRPARFSIDGLVVRLYESTAAKPMAKVAKWTVESGRVIENQVEFGKLTCNFR